MSVLALVCYDGLAMAKSLTEADRRSVAEKLMEWGNLLFVALVVGQFFSDIVNLPAVLVGSIAFAGAYYLARKMMKGGDVS